jgi:hypothetical protein
MLRATIPFVLGLLICVSANADDVVFKSDVALTRVDAQVVDRNGRNVTDLQVDDFVLRVNGKIVPVRNFASEDMPIDIVLLLDVSGSMQPHVERIASAAEQALNVLTDKDRVAIMVFDTSTHVRLPFRSSHSEITNALRHLLRSEGFNGGTRITSAMVSAANYIGREARPEARRAVVILTDDETQDQEDEPRVESALARVNAVLSFLQAPYEPPTFAGRGGGGGRRHGTWGSGGGVGFPGGGTGWPGGGGVGFPRGGGGGGPWGGGGPGGYGMGDPSHSAGTSQVAQDSGGDTMRVEEASSLQDTLTRLRQRYALNFYLPEGTTSGDAQLVKVDLSQEARLRYRDADVHYRRVFMSGATGSQSGPTLISHRPDPGTVAEDPAPVQSNTPSTTSKHHSTAVNEDSSGPKVNIMGDDDPNKSRSDSKSSSTSQPAPAASENSTNGGWPRAKPPL